MGTRAVAREIMRGRAGMRAGIFAIALMAGVWSGQAVADSGPNGTVEGCEPRAADATTDLSRPEAAIAQHLAQQDPGCERPSLATDRGLLPFDAADSPVTAWQADVAGPSTGDTPGDWSGSLAGTDYWLSDDVVFGVAVGHEGIDPSVLQPSGRRGEGFVIAPYLGIAPMEGVQWGLTVGVAGFDGTEIGPELDTQADRWFVSTSLTGDLGFDRLRLAPTVGLSFARQATDGVTGADTGEGGEDRARLSYGGEVGYGIELDDGGLIEPFVNVTTDLDFRGGNGPDIADSTLFSEDDEGTTLGAGVNFNLGGAVTGRIGGSYDAVGREDPDAWTAQGRLRIAF